MIIGSVAGLAKKSLGDAAFVAVAIMAIGNAAGRVIAGIASDKFGRIPTLVAAFMFQGALMLLAIPLVKSQNTSPILIVLLATLIGFNYGANLSLFPSFSKDRYGLKSFGINYGILFTAWGIGGFVMSRISQMLMITTGSFTSSFIISAIMLSIGAMLALTLRASADVVVPKPVQVPEGAMYQSELGLTMADGGEKIDINSQKNKKGKS
jgi:MFS family permease